MSLSNFPAYWNNMRYITGGLIIVILCMGYMVVAEDNQRYPDGVNITQNATWTMSPQAALALEKTDATDIKCIYQTYKFLKTENASLKDDILNVMYDYNGTVSTWLNIVDNSTNQNPGAKADRTASFGTWNELNQTLLQIITVMDDNETVSPELVNKFENTSWDHLQKFDKLMGYVDESSFDQNTSEIQFYLLMMKSLIAPSAYELTKNSKEKEIFSSLMNLFDEKMTVYESRFPHGSSDDLKAIKNDIKAYADEAFSTVDAGSDITKEDNSRLNGLFDKIWNNYLVISE